MRRNTGFNGTVRMEMAKGYKVSDPYLRAFGLCVCDNWLHLLVHEVQEHD